MKSSVGATAFVTDDRRTWVQIDGGEGHFPPVPFHAALENAARGSFFLVSPLGGPRVRVNLRD